MRIYFTEDQFRDAVQRELDTNARHYKTTLRHHLGGYMAYLAEREDVVNYMAAAHLGVDPQFIVNAPNTVKQIKRTIDALVHWLRYAPTPRAAPNVSHNLRIANQGQR